MDLLSNLLIAIGLAMDCFAVSIVAGTSRTLPKARAALVIPLLFGGFQIGMNLIGWLAGTQLVNLIAGFDHWVAFLLLAVIGGKMIWEGGKDEGERGEIRYFAIGTLLVLSIATSIDSLGVGLSFALIGSGILIPVILIGLASWAFSILGILLGDRLAQLFGGRIEILGGLILIGIGIRILLEHGIA